MLHKVQHGLSYIYTDMSPLNQPLEEPVMAIDQAQAKYSVHGNSEKC